MTDSESKAIMFAVRKGVHPAHLMCHTGLDTLGLLSLICSQVGVPVPVRAKRDIAAHWGANRWFRIFQGRSMM